MYDMTAAVAPEIQVITVKQSCEDCSSQTKINPKDYMKILRVIMSHFPHYTLTMFGIYVNVYQYIKPDSSRYESLALNTALMNAENKNQIYRWYTYSILHASNEHIISNMMSLLIYGCLLESGDFLDFIIDFFTTGLTIDAIMSTRQIMSKTVRMFCIHTLSIIAGAFAVFWEAQTTHNQIIKIVGASGGIYGLYATTASNLLLNWQELTLIRKITSLVFLIGMLVCDMTVTGVAIYKHHNTDIAYSSHIGGAVMGLLSGIWFWHNIKKLKWEVYMRCVGAFMAFACFLVSWSYAWR